MIVRFYEYLAIDVLGHPLLFGISLLSIIVLMMMVSGMPRWGILIYGSSFTLALSSPGYHPILIPEWVFYIVLIMLGLIWSAVIIRIKS